MAMKLSSLFIEKYDPLDVYPTMINKNKPGWAFISLFIAILAIIVVVLVGLPDSLPGLGVLIIPAMVGSLMLEGSGPNILYPVRKKRGPRVHTRRVKSWYAPEIAEQDPVYKEKLIEYLDYRRSGGKENRAIELHLADWLIEAEAAVKEREHAEELGIAQTMIDVDYLKAYRKARKDVSSL